MDVSAPPMPFSAAANRNRVPIGKALVNRMPASGRVLEIGAGTGQHAVYLANRFPALSWLPTDRSVEMPGLMARLEAEAGPNVLPARVLDVLEDDWPREFFDAAFSANTAHIMSWEGVRAMLKGVGRCLSGAAPFFLYGPFNRDGRFTAPSNEAFDQSLRARDPAMGLRAVEALDSEARRHQMLLEEEVSMPANNLLLVFRKTGLDEK